MQEKAETPWVVICHGLRKTFVRPVAMITIALSQDDIVVVIDGACHPTLYNDAADVCSPFAAVGKWEISLAGKRPPYSENGWCTVRAPLRPPSLRWTWTGSQPGGT